MAWQAGLAQHTSVEFGAASLIAVDELGNRPDHSFADI
jgi:hypothetical protein